MVGKAPASDSGRAEGRGGAALVVFEDRSDSWLLRLLRPGFRHCFCVIGAGTSWTVCDPLKSRLELTPLHGLTEAELAAHFAATGRAVLRGRVSPDRSVRRVRLRPLNCVEVVKRVLNVDPPGAVTPFRLWRALLALAPPDGPFVPGAKNFILDSGQ